MENSQQNPTGSIERGSNMLFKQSIFSSVGNSEQNIRVLPPSHLYSTFISFHRRLYPDGANLNA